MTAPRGRLRDRRQRRRRQRRGRGAGRGGRQGRRRRGGRPLHARRLQHAGVVGVPGALPGARQPRHRRSRRSRSCRAATWAAARPSTGRRRSARRPRRCALWAERHGVGDIDAATLAPHFAAVEARLDVGPGNPDDVNANNRKLLDGAGKLGWKPELIPPQRQGLRAPRLLRHGLPARRQANVAHDLPGRRDRGRRRRLHRLPREAGRDRPRPRAAPSSPRCWIAPADRPRGPPDRSRPQGRRAGGRRDQHAGAAAALARRHGQRRRRQAHVPAPDRAAGRLLRSADRGASTARPSRCRCTTSPIAARASATSSRPRPSTRCWARWRSPASATPTARIAERLPYVQATIALLIDGHHDDDGRRGVASTASGRIRLRYPLHASLREAADRRARQHGPPAAGRRRARGDDAARDADRDPQRGGHRPHRRRAVRRQRPHPVLRPPDGRLRDGERSAPVGREHARAPPPDREPLDRRRLGVPDLARRQPPASRSTRTRACSRRRSRRPRGGAAK